MKVSYCGKTITITYKVFYISFPDQTIALQECDYPFRLEPKQGTDATYKWPNGETTPFLDINGPGTYNVTVTRCEAPYQISFIVSLKTFRDTTLPFMICNYPDFYFLINLLDQVPVLFGIMEIPLDLESLTDQGNTLLM